MKKIAVILSALILSAGIFSACTNNNTVKIPGNDTQNDNTPLVETENQPEEDANAYKSLYLETVSELNSRYDDVEWTFGLADVNQDKIPELIACYPATISLYTCDNEKVYAVMEETRYGFAGNNGYYYLPGQNVIFNADYDMAGVIVYETYCKIGENNELENYHNKPLYTSIWKDANGDGMPDDNEIGDMVYYFYGSDELTEEAYNELRFGNEADFELLYGEMTFDEIVSALGK